MSPTDSIQPPAAPANARLRAARKRAGLSQPAAAARLGIDPNTLSRYELGKMRVPADVLDQAERLGDRPRAEEPPRPAPDPAVVARQSLPGYWVGRLDGILEGYEQHNARLRAFVAEGARWEANTVRAAAELAAREAARLAGRETSAADLLAALSRASETPIIEGDPPGMEDVTHEEDAPAARPRRRA